ncbi:unnamed protein product [Schistocephalus solidus]|uniref:UBX domain-containing protein n=1 Tax=Schistocephalus solidus TaxID=70667 RepID=A0A183SZ20_SCHSO|nr:unnamed protein product [Schistocephalus solidus]
MDSFPPEVQHISAPDSGSLNGAQLYRMAERLMKMPGIAKPQPAALSTSPVSSVSPLSRLKAERAQLAEQVASLQEPTSSSPRSPPISTARPVQPSSSRRTSTATCWYHITFGARARRKTFRIQRETREEVVSVDRLKAAVLDTAGRALCFPTLWSSTSPTPYPSVPHTSSSSMSASSNCNFLLINLQHTGCKPHSLFPCASCIYHPQWTQCTFS